MKKRALVLSGGGAMGAYTFGCLQAFKEAGIEFDVVAGTSAGALNSVLWSTHSLSEGKKIWENLSFSSIYPVKILNPATHNKYIIRIISALYVFLHLLRAAFNKIPVPGINRLKFVFAFFPVFPFLFLFLIGEAFWGIQFSFYTIAFFVIYIYFASLFKLSSNAYNIAVVTPMIIVAFSSVIVMMIVQKFFHNKSGDWWIGLYILFGIIIYIVIAIFYFMTKSIIDNIFESTSILGSTPLKQKLYAILKNNKIVVKTLVTVAEKTKVFDPDDCVWTTTESVRFISPDTLYYPSVKKVWFPSYIEINRLSIEEAVNYCCASAAIPFGIVQKVAINDKEYVDGGIVDNCPLLSIYEYEEIEEIFIVAVKPYLSDEDAFNGENISYDACRTRHRLKKLKEIPIPLGCKYRRYKYWTAKNLPPTIIPYELTELKSKIIFFCPKKKLGGIFSGVLRFSKDYAQKLMQMGRNDTKAYLNQIGYPNITK